MALFKKDNFLNQSDNHSCGPVSIINLLRWLRFPEHVSKRDINYIAQLCSTASDGTSIYYFHKAIEYLIWKYNMKFDCHKIDLMGTYDKLVEQLDENRAVLLVTSNHVCLVPRCLKFKQRRLFLVPNGPSEDGWLLDKEMEQYVSPSRTKRLYLWVFGKLKSHDYSRHSICVNDVDYLPVIKTWQWLGFPANAFHLRNLCMLNKNIVHTEEMINRANAYFHEIFFRKSPVIVRKNRLSKSSAAKILSSGSRLLCLRHRDGKLVPEIVKNEKQLCYNVHCFWEVKPKRIGKKESLKYVHH